MVVEHQSNVVDFIYTWAIHFEKGWIIIQSFYYKSLQQSFYYESLL